MQIESSEQAARWNLWPLSIIAFFIVAIIGCGSLIAFCNRHPADLVAADYYEQEVRYQGQMESMRRAQSGLPAAVVSYEVATQNIVISLPPGRNQGRPKGSIQLYRPSAVALDQQFKLEPDVAGVQKIDASRLNPGLWKVRISWEVDQQEYFVDEKVVIQSRS